MGGITKTKAREKIFYTSVPVLFGRKAAIFSKANAKRFTSFKEINQPGVTVIENLGGTNALYAKANISKAQLVVVKKNADVFACLLKNPEKPWLMLTDNIEVSFRAKQSQGMLSAAGLEIALPNNPVTEKVYLLPKTVEGKKLLGAVNKLIKSLQSSHQLFSIYQQALAAKYDFPAATCPLTKEEK
jgi:cyclohexadienyl dehydratase